MGKNREGVPYHRILKRPQLGAWPRRKVGEGKLGQAGKIKGLGRKKAVVRKKTDLRRGQRRKFVVSTRFGGGRSGGSGTYLRGNVQLTQTPS